jgi:hypothetical protein
MHDARARQVTGPAIEPHWERTSLLLSEDADAMVTQRVDGVSRSRKSTQCGVCDDSNGGPIASADFRIETQRPAPPCLSD